MILPLLVLMMTVHGWLARDVAAEELAQEVARTMSIAADWDAGIDLVVEAESRMEARMDSALRPCPEVTGCLRVHVSGSLDPGSHVDATVNVWMPGPAVPLVGAVSGFWVTARHREVIDPYRSGS